MVVTCSACSHGWCETLLPKLAMTHHHHLHKHPLYQQERSVVAANCGFVQRSSRCFASPPHLGAKVSCHNSAHTENDINLSVYPHELQIADAAITCARISTHGMGDIPMGVYLHGVPYPEPAAMGLSDDVLSHLLRTGQGRISTRTNAAIAGADHALNDSITSESTSAVSILKHPALPSIPTAKRVVLVRHGQSTWNAEGRIQGSSDFAVLTPKGEIQAETSRQMLLSDVFDVCFHSPLARAKRTAEIIWGARTDEMIPIDDLREIDLYGFQGLMKNEGKERYGDAYRTWQRDAANFLIDGHYPVRELWARAQKCWQEILCHEGQSILVVAHNAVNQALVATATGLGPEYFRQLLQSNCGVSVLDFTPTSKGNGPPYVCLERLNQVAYNMVKNLMFTQEVSDQFLLEFTLCKVWQHYELLHWRQPRTWLCAVGGWRLPAPHGGTGGPLPPTAPSWVCGASDLEAYDVGYLHLGPAVPCPQLHLAGYAVPPM